MRETPHRRGAAAVRRPGGLRALLRPLRQSLLAFFQRRTRDPEAAADLTAETFAAALSRAGASRRGATPAAAWLFAIAHHKLTDYRRRGRPRAGCARGWGWSPSPVGAEDAELIRWLGEEVATQMVEELPPTQRDAIRAHVLEDRDYARDRARRQLSEATVRKRVSRGLKVLRERAGGNR